MCAAPKENQFWKLRSKHGRDKLFETPELLWEAACEYFEWCDENPLMEVDFKGKDADRVEIPKMRPFTLQGLCLYLDCNTAYLRTFKSQSKGKHEDFNAVITKIEEVIYNQKFTGAAAGFLNPNIIARDLGLADKKEEKVTNFNYNTDLSKEDIKEINDALEKEV
jgi:hypothetical protein